MEITPALAVTIPVAAGVGLVLLLALLDGWNPRENRRRKQRDAHERTLPLYERLALAEERRGEAELADGYTHHARTHFREAKRIRDNAQQALERGELPEI